MGNSETKTTALLSDAASIGEPQASDRNIHGRKRMGAPVVTIRPIVYFRSYVTSENPRISTIRGAPTIFQWEFWNFAMQFARCESTDPVGVGPIVI